MRKPGREVCVAVPRPGEGAPETAEHAPGFRRHLSLRAVEVGDLTAVDRHDDGIGHLEQLEPRFLGDHGNRAVVSGAQPLQRRQPAEEVAERAGEENECSDYLAAVRALH